MEIILYYYLIIQVIAVGTILVDELSQVASNPLPDAWPTPFHKALFPPHHQKLVSQNYPHLLNENQPNFYPFHQQYSSYQPNFGYHYPHPHQAYFGNNPVNLVILILFKIL